MQAIQHFDASLFAALNQTFAHPAMDALMLAISDRVTWFVVAAVAIGWGIVAGKRQALMFCLALGVAIGLTDLFTYKVLKPTFARERPCYQLEDVRLVQSRCGSDYGFPSNHAANSMATVVMAALTLRKAWVWIMFGLALLVGFSRIYLGVHFPGDIAAGYMAGALVAGLCYLLLVPIQRRWRRRAEAA